jgi:hypothetical protein
MQCQPIEQFPFCAVSGEVANQAAFGCVCSQLFQMLLIVLHRAPRILGTLRNGYPTPLLPPPPARFGTKMSPAFSASGRPSDTGGTAFCDPGKHGVPVSRKQLADALLSGSQALPAESWQPASHGARVILRRPASSRTFTPSCTMGCFSVGQCAGMAFTLVDPRREC